MYLIDTNLLSEFARPNPSRSVVAWYRTTDPAGRRVSVVTLAEIRFGIENLADGDRRSALEEWYRSTVLDAFSGQILDLDIPVLIQAQAILKELRVKGRAISHSDLLIAATARHYGLTLVTRNMRDFKATGIALLDPWQTSEQLPPGYGLPSSKSP